MLTVARQDKILSDAPVQKGALPLPHREGRGRKVVRGPLRRVSRHAGPCVASVVSQKFVE